MSSDAGKDANPIGYHITGPRGWVFVLTRDEVEPACEALCKITGDLTDDCVAREGRQLDRPASRVEAETPGAFKPDTRAFRRRHLLIAAGVGAGVVILAVAPVVSDRYAHLTSAVTPSDIFTRACAPDRFEVSSVTDRTEGDYRVLTGTIRNGNPIACGVQIAVDVHDTGGQLVASEKPWPFSVRNLAAGSTEEFQTTLPPEVASRAATYAVRPVDTRVWPSR